MITATFVRTDSPTTFTRVTVTFSADYAEKFIDSWGMTRTAFHPGGMAMHLGTVKAATEFKRSLKAQGVKVVGSLAAPKAVASTRTAEEKAAYLASWV